MMTLTKFRVTNFRSVMDSGWIDCDDVTTLVGINEAGKSNLILALWKLNPAREGEIDLLHDMPTKEYTMWRNSPQKYSFISACFDIDNNISAQIAKIAGCAADEVNSVIITRNYAGKYSVEFPKFSTIISIPVDTVSRIVRGALSKIDILEEKTQGETGIKTQTQKALNDVSSYIDDKIALDNTDSQKINSLLDVSVKAAARSEISPVFESAVEEISKAFSALMVVNPRDDDKVFSLITDNIPTFVYYSNYGNLDAQIYLPHAMKLVKGEPLPGFDNAAKARTLKVLFEFVNLSPEEVYELGKNPETTQINPQTRQVQQKEPTSKEIEDYAAKKEEREIMLQSASSRLTREFAEWWKQGEYKFRLHADGDYFRILVSDDKRPEEIALELRSTGLQWFLSFFLVFLVERRDSHKGAILLLDEAGLTLHPLAQKDLVIFFDGLAENNQIIHTTHSPFLISTSNIDRVKVVYSNNDGYTVCSANLRDSDDKLSEKSIYAVHAALGLSVSDILLNGCQPIIVEGTSDQYYLNAIKLFLIKHNKLSPDKELIFIPSGGCTNKSVKAIAGLVSGRNGELPYIVLDSDNTANSAKKRLLEELYKDAANRLISVADVIGFDNSEVEDLLPFGLLNNQLNKWFSHLENDFEPTENLPILPQIEKFAQNNNIDLPDGWKVLLAKNIKTQLLKDKTSIDNDLIDKWIKLFRIFGNE